MEEITPPIRKACEKFIADGCGTGKGAKQDILKLLENLAQDAAKAAGGPAAKLLKARFSEVQDEILAALSAWGDPIEQASNALVEREETRRRRSDAQRRTTVLAALDAIRTTIPPTPRISSSPTTELSAQHG